MGNFRSKRGVALPVAIVITSVLVVLTSSLIIIALNSLSNTTVDVNTRQAYINAKSALQYTAHYYNGGATLPGGGGTLQATEFIAMNDVGGTCTEGASVVASSAGGVLPSTVSSAKTYVEATFIPKTTTGDKDHLRLTAYALASDTFGQKARIVQLTAIYEIQGGSGNPKKVTSIVEKNTGSEVTYNTNDSITLNVRTNAEYDFVPYFYTWTYKDQKGGNTGTGGHGYYYGTSQTSIGETYSVFQNKYDNVKAVETAGGSTPSGKWNTDSSNAGPQGVSVQKAGTNDWYQHNYSIVDDNVNYFNAIVARKGAMLTQTNGSISNAHKIQSCEMFHLWYGDPNDKNIYFEILQGDFYYYYSQDWNGLKGLENYFLVYTSRPATVVHVKVINDRDNPIEDNSAAPSLDIAGLGGYTLKYEGCGWWVATVETSSNFKATVTVGAKSYSTSATPSSNKEAWIVVNKSGSGSIVSKMSESNANAYMNIDDDSYVTVSAKSYKGKTSTAPVLKYKFEMAQSSTAKRNLLNKILEAQEYVSTDYTDDSWAELTNKLNAAIEVYNKVDLQTDADYDTARTDLEAAIKNLSVVACDVETLNELKNLYNNNYSKYMSNQKYYDSAEFAKLQGLFSYCSDVLNSNVPLNVRDADGNLTGTTHTSAQMTKTIVSNAITALTNELAEIEKDEYKLDRDAMDVLIGNAASIVHSVSYDADQRDILAQILGEASDTIAIGDNDYENYTAYGVQNTISMSKTNFDYVYRKLETQYNLTIALSKFSDNYKKAAKLLGKIALTDDDIAAGIKVDYGCTDATYAALEAAYNNAETAIANISAYSSEAITDLDNALGVAIANFVVCDKPATSTSGYAENIIRVWLDISEVYDVGGVSAADAGITVLIKQDGGSEYAATVQVATDWDGYYFEIDRTQFNKASVTWASPVDGNAYKSDFVDITEQNQVLCVTAYDGVTLTVEKKHMVTLSVADIVGNAECGGNFVPYVTITADGTATTTSQTMLKDSSNYYYCRFVYAAGTKVTVYQFDEGVAPPINSEVISIPNYGEYVAKLTYNVSLWKVDLIDLATIHPKTNFVTVADPASLVAYNYSSDNSYTVSTLLKSNLTSDFSIQKLSTSYTEITVSAPTGQTMIWFDTKDVSGISGTPWVYAWNPTTGAKSAAWPGTQMIAYGDTAGRYYYATVPNDLTKVIIRLSSADSDSNKIRLGNGDMSFKINSATSKPYSYQTFDKSSTSEASSASESKPTIAVTTTAGSLTGTTTEVSMAFVGGKYYQLTNQSYGVTFGTSWTYPFGGVWNGSSGSSCDGRVGDTKATTMYDWYDYKLSIDSGDLYSVQIKGLSDSGSVSTSVYTETAQNIWGNSWFVLNSDSTSSSLFSDVSLYSFDPADAQVTDDVTIYLKVPSTNWSNIKLTATGFGNNTYTMTSHTDAAGKIGSTCYAATISSSTPYLEFTADVTDSTTGSKTTVSYKTALRGGDYVLFDPTLNLGAGAWQIFVDPITELRREIVQSVSTYFGKVLPTAYDANGFASGDYEKPEGFQQYLKGNAIVSGGFLTSNNEVKDTAYYSGSSTNVFSSWSLSQTAYNSLHKARLAYESLYSVMASARAYIGGKNYPEYLARGTTATYNIGNLSSDYASAAAAYKSSSSSLTTINSWVSTLKTDIASITVENQNSAIAVFADVRNVVSENGRIYISYTANGVTVTNKQVTSVNTEGYPIYFISGDATNVKFTWYDSAGMSGTTDAQDIAVNEAYVWLDYTSAGYWSPNATVGYLEVNSNEITQNNSTAKYNITFDDAGSGYMTVYFAYDTVVNTVSNGSYTIYAGSYEFETSSTGIIDGYGISVPFELDGSVYKMNLYSSEAKTYFETAEVIGQFSSAQTGESLGWVDSTSTSGVHKLVVTSTKSTSSYVNVTVNSVKNYNANLGSTQGMYFRYTGNNKITINNKSFKLAAPEIRLALPNAGVSASTINSHFYLASGDSIADKIKVKFITDVHVQYTDALGTSHDFVIHEGMYQLSKNPDFSGQIGVIADLFDESYWKDNKYVKLLNGSDTGSFGGESGTLGGEIFS